MVTNKLNPRGNWKRPCPVCKKTPKDGAVFSSHTTNGRTYRSSFCHVCIGVKKQKGLTKSSAKAAKNREAQYKWRYGATRQELENLLKSQGDICAICKASIAFGFDAPYRPGQTKRNSTARVDHCHNSKKIRGILCAPCNSGIGQLKDDPEIVRAALIYLESEES